MHPPRRITLADQLALLFQYGESRGISPALKTIAVATGENANNIRKIRDGENANPGLRTLTALAEYFQVDLAYFGCRTKVECQKYLAEFASKRLLDQIAAGANGLSDEGQAFILMIVDYIRKAEARPPVHDLDASAR